MSYTKTKKKIDELTICEVSALKANGLQFHSKYEAESIIRLQIEQAGQEMNRCRKWSESLTDAVGAQRDIGVANYAEELERQAKYLSVEAVRLAGVARYLAETEKEKKGGKA